MSRLQTLASRITQTSDRLAETWDRPAPLQAYGDRLTQAWGRPSSPSKSARFKGGDPSDEFHAIRQFLLLQGIDTRVFSFGSIALPAGINGANVTDDMGTVDNSFYFEFHRTLSLDRPDVPKVNVLVLIVRCFFQEEKDGRTTLHAQLVLNHHRDGVYDLNDEYEYLIGLATAEGWIQPYSEETGNRVTFFEKAYTDMNDFRRFVLKMQPKLQADYETSSNAPSNTTATA